MCIYVYLSAQIPKYTYTLLHIITHVPPLLSMILIILASGPANPMSRAARAHGPMPLSTTWCTHGFGLYANL